MGCMTDFGYVILDTNLLMFMTIQACTSTPAKILLSGYHSKKRNDNPPRMWSNTSKIGFAMISDTFRTWGFSPVLYTRL